ncbi:MAG: ribbon-helix-helix domain-containing protein [Candidatus Bathyarchaeia archaeon]|jgi:hypothetical protein
MSKVTTISVSPETLATWNELSERTRIPISRLLKEITENIQKQLDLMKPNTTLNFLTDLYIDSKTANLPKTIIRLSDANSFGLDHLTKEQRDEVLKAFDYDEHFHDLREKPEPQQTPHPQIEANKQ